MKRRLFLLLPILALLGCSTSQDGTSTITPQRVEKVSRLAAYSSFKVQLIKDPTSRPTLVQISTAVNELVAAQTWDVATMITVANANGLSELTSDEAQIALTTAPLFIDLFLNKEVDLRQQEYAEAFIVGAADGFKMALGSGAPASRSGQDATLVRLSAEARATR